MSDGLRPDRANRIADAVEDIERNVTRLRDLQSLSHEEYVAPAEQDRRDAVERKFEKLTEAVLDTATEICKAERGSAPERRKDVISALANEDIIDDHLAERLRTAVAFRDVLAHTYGPIVNDDIVYDALQNDLSRYVEFVESVAAYVDAR